MWKLWHQMGAYKFWLDLVCVVSDHFNCLSFFILFVFVCVTFVNLVFTGLLTQSFENLSNSFGTFPPSFFILFMASGILLTCWRRLLTPHHDTHTSNGIHRSLLSLSFTVLSPVFLSLPLHSTLPPSVSYLYSFYPFFLHTVH